MGVFKKVIAGCVVVALIAGAGYAGLHYIRRSNQKTITVVPVSSLQSELYSSDSTLEGTITTNISQNISVGNDVVIENVFVNVGDEVAKGDKLVSFDNTLVKMELEIDKLKHQKLEIDLNNAINRLNSLKNGGPILESDGNSGAADNLNFSNTKASNIDTSGTYRGTYLAARLLPLSLEEELSSGPEHTPSESGVIDGDVINDTSGDNGASEDPLTSGEGGSFPAITEPAGGPTPTPALINPVEIDGLTDGEVTFYETLDYSAVPYTGTGSKEDPFIFLCSSKKGYVTVMGSFFNRMAGYSEDGGMKLYEGGYWYTLEFYKDDKIADVEDRQNSCIGYYNINGSLLEKPVNPFVQVELTIEEALKYETEPEDPGDLPEDPGDGGGEEQTTLTRAEAIKIQEQKIKRLQLDIKESDINIGKLEKRVEQTEIYAKIDGIVSHVGDPLTGKSNGDAFLKVKSKEGFYLTGTVSELMRDEMKEGTVLDCMSYMSGTFEASVLQVADYPVSGTTYYYGDGNPNVSFYTYTAEISDQTMQFSEYDYVTVSMQKNAQEDGMLILTKSFVRSENGNYYVFKDDHGVLKKQPVQVGDIVNGGYYIVIKSGITSKDRLAFPYGDLAKDGTLTQEGTLDSLYI